MTRFVRSITGGAWLGNDVDAVVGAAVGCDCTMVTSVTAVGCNESINAATLAVLEVASACVEKEEFIRSLKIDWKEDFGRGVVVEVGGWRSDVSVLPRTSAKNPDTFPCPHSGYSERTSVNSVTFRRWSFGRILSTRVLTSSGKRGMVSPALQFGSYDHPYCHDSDSKPKSGLTRRSASPFE